MKIERALKRLRSSITLPEDAAHQGREILERARQNASILSQLAAVQPAEVEALAGHLQEYFDELASSPKEPAVQKLLDAVIEIIRPNFNSKRLETRALFDTSRSGLSFSPEQGRPRTDISICDRFSTLGNLVTVLEAKGSLSNTSKAHMAAYQILQRCKQMSSLQQRRQRWLMATVGSDGVEIWTVHLHAQVSLRTCLT